MSAKMKVAVEGSDRECEGCGDVHRCVQEVDDEAGALARFDYLARREPLTGSDGARWLAIRFVGLQQPLIVGYEGDWERWREMIDIAHTSLAHPVVLPPISARNVDANTRTLVFASLDDVFLMSIVEPSPMSLAQWSVASFPLQTDDVVVPEPVQQADMPADAAETVRQWNRRRPVPTLVKCEYEPDKWIASLTTGEAFVSDGVAVVPLNNFPAPLPVDTLTVPRIPDPTAESGFRD